MADTIWIKVTPPNGYSVETRSMVDSAADSLHTALNAIDHRASAEVFTDAEMREYHPT